MSVLVFIGQGNLLAQKTFNQGGCAGPNATLWTCNGNWTPGGVPGSTDNVIINTGTCNVNTGSQSCNNLTVNLGTTLNVNTGATLTVNGNLVVSGTFNINTGATVTINGTITINAGGTISDNRNGTGSFVIAGNSITNNGTLAQPGTLYANLTNSGTINIGGTSTDYNNFAFSLVTSGQVVNFNSSSTNLWGFDVNTGTTLNIAAGSNVTLREISVEGNANFNNATVTIIGGTSSNVSPDNLNPYFPTGQPGEGTFNAGTSTVIYGGNVNQIIRSTTYYNLIVRNYNTRIKGIGNAYSPTALGGTLPVNVSNDLSLDVMSSGGISATFNPVNIGRHFNLATNNTSLSMDLYADHLMQRTGGSGNFTMGNNANNRIFVGYTHATNTFLQGYGNANTFYGRVIYDASSGVQKVVGATYNHLNIQGGGNKDLMAHTTINADLTITGGTLDATTSNFNLDVKGNFTHSGGGFNPRNATVFFTGTTDQTLSTSPITSTASFTANGPVTIPDNTPSGGVAAGNTVPTLASLTSCTPACRANLSVNVPAGTYLGLHSISFNITHTWTADLDIYLVTPDNTVYVVSTDNGGSGYNYTNTTIMDGFPNINTASAPFRGIFSWEDTRLMSSYAGPLVGTWRLYVVDDSGGDTGSIQNFTVTLATSTTPFTFYNLTLNKTGNLTLAGTSTAVQVNNIGTFTNGYLVTSATRRLDFAAGSSVSGGSNASHIVGTARKIGNTSFVFPLGNGTYYAGIGFNPSGSTAITDHFTATYTRVSPHSLYPTSSKEASIDHVSNCEYWTLDRTNGSQNATVTLHFDDTRSCGVNAPSELLVCRWNGTQWTNGGNGGVSGSFVTSAVTFTSFSPFTLGSSTPNNPLPVDLRSFTAFASKYDAMLHWETLMEFNLQEFVIERSINGKDFEIIGRVEALNKGNRYQFTDLGIGLKLKEAFYRLKMLDKAGTFKYSNIVSVKFVTDKFEFLAVEPNPIQTQFSLVYLLPNKGFVKMDILDMLGKTIDTQIIEGNSGMNRYLVEKDLPSGMYLVTMQFQDVIITKKIVR